MFDKFTEWWTSLGLVKVFGVRRTPRLLLPALMTFITRWTYQTRNLLLIFTPHFITFFWKKILKHLYLNILWASIDLQWVKIYFNRWCRRYNYVFTVFNNTSPLTLRLFITYNRHSTVFSLTKTEEHLKNLSKKLHRVYFR